MRIPIYNYRLTTIQVLYYMPDYNSLVQEFIWQTMDLDPEYPRIRRFLKYWENHIEAAIKEVKVASVDSQGTFVNASDIFKM